MTPTVERLFARLAEPRVRREPARRIAAALDALDRASAGDAQMLVRLHERLLFLAAYPPGPAVLRRADALLGRLARRVAALAAAGDDLSAFDEPELAGIAETELATEYSYGVVRWLAARYPRRVRIAWDLFEEFDRLGAALPRFVPLLEEEALADANVPYRDWLAAAGAARGRELEWLLERFERWAAEPRRKAEVFDALRLPIAWDLRGGGPSRTRLRRPVRAVFYQPGPLLARRDVSLARELASGPLPVRRLSRAQGARALDVARESTALRYREFYGFTHGDPETVRAARVGRGVEIFFFGVEREWRLPFRAGYTALVLKNGIPAAYYEGLAIGERMEAGFNVYYTFREGESAWIYAQVLRLCRQLTGVSSFSIDPYQVGYRNEEAIESGAFWFYRKLGFAPTDPGIARRLAREEARLAARPGARTPAATLRRLASCHLIYETEGAGESSPFRSFHVRNLGLAVVRRMRREFDGDAGAIRRESTRSLSRKLGAHPARWDPRRRRAFEDLSLLLDLIPDLARWTPSEKEGVLAVAWAKAGRSEDRYLRLLQRHRRLREALIRLGSVGSRIRRSRDA